PPSGRSVIRRKNGGKRRGGRQAGSSTGALSGSFPRIPSTVSCQYALAFVRGARHTRHHRSKCEKRPRMLEHVPAWLGKTLRNVRAGHGKLAVARLSGAATLNNDGFALRSAAFEDGERLDPSFTADEEDSVAPPLEWSAPPAGTEE